MLPSDEDPNVMKRRALKEAADELLGRFQYALGKVPPLPSADQRYVRMIKRADEEVQCQRSSGSGTIDQAAAIKAGYQSQVTFVFVRSGTEGDLRWEMRNHHQAILCTAYSADVLKACSESADDGWYFTLKALQPAAIRSGTAAFVYEVLTAMDLTTRFTHVWVMAPETVLRALLPLFCPRMNVQDLDVLFGGLECNPSSVLALRDGHWIENDKEV